MAKQKMKMSVGRINPAVAQKAAAPRAADVDGKQDARPDPTGPVMTYAQRRAAIRELIKEDPERTDNPRTAEETEKIIDQHMALEHLPGPIPEGKIFTVCAFKDGKKMEGQNFVAMTHQEAVQECGAANGSAPDGVWYGVDHLPVEAQ